MALASFQISYVYFYINKVFHSLSLSVVWWWRGGLVGWCRVRNGLVFGIRGVAFVLDVSNVAAVAVRVSCVSRDLSATIRQSNPVVAVDQLGVASLSLAKGRS